MIMVQNARSIGYRSPLTVVAVLEAPLDILDGRLLEVTFCEDKHRHVSEDRVHIPIWCVACCDTYPIRRAGCLYTVPLCGSVSP